MEELRVRRLKILLLVSSLVCLAFLLLAAFEENFTADWRAPQIEYARLLPDKMSAGSDAERAPDYPIELRQVFLKDWNRVDRCVTCHVGIDNPAFRDGMAARSVTRGKAAPRTRMAHTDESRFGIAPCWWVIWCRPHAPSVITKMTCPKRQRSPAANIFWRISAVRAVISSAKKRRWKKWARRCRAPAARFRENGSMVGLPIRKVTCPLRRCRAMI